jgi:dTMP kinase
MGGDIDRTTTIGKMIDAYLRSAEDLDDHVIHLLFSANRWEARYAVWQSAAVDL